MYLTTVSDLFSKLSSTKCQYCQLCVLRENSIVLKVPSNCQECSHFKRFAYLIWISLSLKELEILKRKEIPTFHRIKKPNPNKKFKSLYWSKFFCDTEKLGEPREHLNFVIFQNILCINTELMV